MYAQDTVDETPTMTDTKEPVRLEGKRVLVVGLGRSGVAAARFALTKTVQVTVSDSRERAALGADADALEAEGVRIEAGSHHTPTFLEQEVIIVSPGVPMSTPALQRAREQGIPTVSEIEVAASYLDVPIVAITGTNGKSTVTTLLGEVITATGVEAFVGGNLGTPLVEGVPGASRKDYLVVEVSSYQLEGIESFRPMLAMILNISEDHLDRYDSFDDYVRAKARILANQTATDTAIVNHDDPVTRELAGACTGRVVFTSLEGRPPGPAAWAEGDRFVIDLGEAGQEIYSARDLNLEGLHNRANALAALAAARVLGLDGEEAMDTIRSFEGLPHRMESVATVRGVRYVNDSKATNAAAAARSVATYREGVVLLAGGVDKGGSYEALASALRGRARGVFVYGEGRERIAAALGEVAPVERVDTLDEAVAGAKGIAEAGDVVLLSPACSSFDQFENFEQRGFAFRHLVHELARDETR